MSEMRKLIEKGVPEQVKQDAKHKAQFSPNDGVRFDPKWQDSIADK